MGRAHPAPSPFRGSNPRSRCQIFPAGESSIPGRTQDLNPANGVQIPALPPFCFFHNTERNKQPSTDGAFFKERKPNIFFETTVT